VIGADSDDAASGAFEFLRIPSAADPGYSRALLNVVREQSPDLLVPTELDELPAIARMKREILRCGTEICISEPWVIDIANDKYVTVSTLCAHGIAVPRSVLSAHVRNAVEAGEILGYPFLAKPRFGHGGKGVAILTSETNAARENRENLVYQEFIGGLEYDVNLFSYPGGNVRSLAVLLRNGAIDGNAQRLRRVVQRDVAGVALVVAKRLRLEGPVDLKIRLGAGDVPRVLEIDACVGANVLSAPETLDELFHVSTRKRHTGTRYGIRDAGYPRSS
jgi:carbamoyl-phosphate synthase large subunit